MSDEYLPDALIEVQNLDGGDMIRHQGRWMEILHTRKNGAVVWLAVFDEEDDRERLFVSLVSVQHRARKLKPKAPTVSHGGSATFGKKAS